jgi:hypothetical protein
MQNEIKKISIFSVICFVFSEYCFCLEYWGKKHRKRSEKRIQERHAKATCADPSE